MYIMHVIFRRKNYETDNIADGMPGLPALLKNAITSILQCSVKC